MSSPVQDPAVATPHAWSHMFLLDGSSLSWRIEGRRLAIAVGLASLFGAAVGLRGGPAALGVHAFGVALGIVAVTALAVPALGILLALGDAGVHGLGLARATSRAAATGGIVLAGLAPAAVLFAVTVEDAITVTIVGLGGLALAGGLAMRSFVISLWPHLASDRHQTMVRVAVPLFLLFASVLATRVWWVSLPLLRGAL